MLAVIMGHFKCDQHPPWLITSRFVVTKDTWTKLHTEQCLLFHKEVCDLLGQDSGIMGIRKGLKTGIVEEKQVSCNHLNNDHLC